MLEIDRFISPRSLWLLEVELDDAGRLHDELDLPDWVPVVREVTGDPAYTNAALARPDRSAGTAHPVARVPAPEIP